MSEKTLRSFMFDFLKNNIKYEISFLATVTKEEAKLLCNSILNNLYEKGYEINMYHEIIKTIVGKYKEEFQITNFTTEAHSVFWEEENDGWHKGKDAFHIWHGLPYYSQVSQRNEYIGNWDYYYSIYSIGNWDTFPGECYWEGMTVISRRIKQGNKYNYKTIQQFGNLDESENSFTGTFEFFEYDTTFKPTTQKELNLIFGLEYKGREEKREKMHENVILPIEIPKAHYFYSFTEFLNILKDIEDINSIGEVKERVQTKQQIEIKKEYF